MTTSDCPPGSVLESIAAGRIQEPLLGVYLDHLAECGACCSEIERRSGRLAGASVGGGRSGDAAPAIVGNGADRLDRLGPWLERLKARTSSRPVDEALAIGRRVGPFRIVAILGEGASSVVYEAIDEDLGRKVVLKICRSVGVDDAERRRLIVGEARALAAVQHESIMPVLQLLWVDDLPVLVFPRLPGETLADALSAGRLARRDALDVVRQVARALGHAHGLGICHRDVKPSNIWLHRRPGDGRDRALLFDFGLAGVDAGSFGTPGYCDPVAETAQPPQSGDLFSLGVVLHECMARFPDAPRECRNLVRRMTAEPADRRPDAMTVAAEIDGLLRSADRPRLATPAIMSLVAVAFIGLFSVVPSSFTGPRRGAEGGLLVPESVLPSRGLPVAVSSDGTLECFVEGASTLRVWNLVKDEEVVSIPLPFRPDRLVFSADRTLVGLGHPDGDVGIVDVASTRVVKTHRFEGRVAWIGWTGWQRDALAILASGQVHLICLGRIPPGKSREERSCTITSTLREGIVRLASRQGSEAMVSVDDEEKLTVWSAGSFAPDEVFPISVERGVSTADDFGWKSQGVCYFAHGRRVYECASHLAVRHYDVLEPVDAIRWVGDSEYVELSHREDGRSRLTLGDFRHPESRRECDPGEEPLDRIEVFDDQRQFVAITRSGGARVYRVPR